MSYATSMPTHPRHHQYVNMTVCCWQFWNRAVIQERQLCRAALPQWATFLAVTHWESTCSSLWLSRSMGMRQKPLPPPPASNWDVQALYAEPAELRRQCGKRETAGKAPAVPQTVLLSLYWLFVCVGHLQLLLRHRFRQDCVGAGDSAFSKSSQVMPSWSSEALENTHFQKWFFHHCLGFWGLGQGYCTCWGCSQEK